MKKTFFLKVFCCLLILCLFSGCKPQSPLLAHADDTDGLDQTQVHFSMGVFCSVENAEGKNLRWFSLSGDPYPKTTASEHRIFELEGNMEQKKISKDERSISLEIPFSKTLTVCSVYDLFPEETAAVNELKTREGREKVHSKTSIVLYAEDCSVYQYIDGDWSKVIYHCNNVTELYGDLSEFSYRIAVSNNFPDVKPSKDNIYDVKGKGEKHVIIALVDGEVLTEGMEGNYTVTHSKRIGDKVTEIVKEYDENGNLLSTTEE